MRLFRFLYLFAVAPLLLACETPQSSPRLDFIANGTATTADRKLNVGDTVEVRVFAQARKQEPLLKRLTITSQEQYYFDANRSNLEDTARVYYFRDNIRSESLLFTHRFSTSANAGRQTWTYTTEDEQGHVASRKIVITVRPTDSANAMRTYAVGLLPPRNRTNRAALSVLRGYALPPHATDTLAYQRLTDILYVPTGAGVTLASPSSTAAEVATNFRVRNWRQRRATTFAVTGLSATAFDNITTEAALTAAVTAAAPAAGSTPALASGQVVAFRTADGNTGLLRISDLSTTTGLLSLNIKVRR